MAKLSSTGTLTYSTLLGGAGDDAGTGIGVDASGNAYVTGSTLSANFPTTGSAYDVTYPNSSSGFVTKLNAAGTALAFSTYLDYGSPLALKLNAAGEVFVAGNAFSGYPTTIGAYRVNCGPGFVTKLTSSGSAAVYSTCMPFVVSGVAVDTDGNVYAASSGEYNTYYGAWLYKLNPTGTNIPLQLQPDPSPNSTFHSIALDGSGDILLGGQLGSRAAAVRVTQAGTVASYYFFAPDSSAVKALAVDGTGAVYAAGWASTGQFVTTNGAYDTTFGGQNDAFVAKLDLSGTVTSTATVDTRPQGLAISVDGVPGTSPRTYNWTAGQAHTVSITSPQAGPPGTRYQFSYWSPNATGTNISYVPNISGPNQLIAYFKPQYQINVTANPLTGGAVTNTGANSGWTDAGSVTATAYPNPGFRFLSWSGDFTSTSQNPAYTTFDIDRPGTILANFVTCQAATPAGIVIGPEASYSNVTLGAADGCVWSASVSSTWVNGSRSATLGRGTISLSHYYLLDPFPRTATLQVSGGSNVSIVQKQPTVAWKDANGGLVVGTRKTTVAPTLPAAFASAAAATQTLGGDTIVVARDGYGGLYALRFNAATQTWSSAWFLGGAAVGTPAITMAANGTAVMAIRDSWNSCWLRTIDPANGSGSWTPLGGIISTDPAIAAGPGSSVYVVAKDSWGGIWTNRYVMGSGAQGWRFGGGIVKGAPSILVGTDDTAYIAVRDNSDAVWMGRVQQETWLPWNWAAGIVATDPQIVTNGSIIRLVSTDSSGNIFYRGWSPYLQSFDEWTQQWAALQDFSTCSVGSNDFVVGRARGTGMVEWYRLDGTGQPEISGVVATGPVSCGPR